MSKTADSGIDEQQRQANEGRYLVTANPDTLEVRLREAGITILGSVDDGHIVLSISGSIASARDAATMALYAHYALFSISAHVTFDSFKRTYYKEHVSYQGVW